MLSKNKAFQPHQVACLSCSRIAGFSRVDTSWVISSPLAIVRSRRRMIFPERVCGRLSPKRISSGLAIVDEWGQMSGVRSCFLYRPAG